MVVGAVAQAFSLRPWLGHVGFVLDKVAMWQVSHANSHSSKCSMLNYTTGLVQ
jgi:hypothetical protein